MFIKTGQNDQGMKRIFLSANDHQPPPLLGKLWSEALFPCLPFLLLEVMLEITPERGGLSFE